MRDFKLIYDIAIVGGGIHGCGIARDAAGRGLSVYLCEQGDFAAATSSSSTKLVHGGLRYLENLDFRLVRDALSEREILMRIAPHLVHPLRFVLPHHSGLRPAWMLRFGLWLYDHVAGGSSLPPASAVDLTRDPAGAPLKPQYRRGFAYFDCSVDDARLVIVNAVDAAERGASMNPRTECVGAQSDGGTWRVQVRRANGHADEVRARILVNATGPWVNRFLQAIAGIEPNLRVRLDKGSHIVVPRLFPHDSAYLFQNADRRVVFAIPYHQDFTLIGTTEEDYRGDPAAAAISESEIGYLLDSANAYFRLQLSADKIVWSYSGVRTLIEQPGAESRKLSREYALDLNQSAGAPILTVYGGKLTTYRRVAEAAVARLSPLVRMQPPWTASAVLPGGDLAPGGIGASIGAFAREYPFLDRANLRRMIFAYGTRIRRIAASSTGMERSFGCGISEAELRYLAEQEWARTAEDVLWRRSKLGLRCGEVDEAGIAEWLTQNEERGARSEERDF
ncbi:MAG TPA: glycerol-3-phosphate dehydrogenase [Micropepsaceae bacterium]|nr:glycerol-3-phosphate dehydrogenase [Micropepsaceae bacterium]